MDLRVSSRDRGLKVLKRNVCKEAIFSIQGAVFEERYKELQFCEIICDCSCSDFTFEFFQILLNFSFPIQICRCRTASERKSSLATKMETVFEMMTSHSAQLVLKVA